MLKRQSKKLAIMLVFSFIATLFVGVGAASAATVTFETSGRIPTINTDVSSNVVSNIADVVITEDDDRTDSFENGDYFTLQLPSGVKWISIADGLENHFKVEEQLDLSTKVWTPAATATDMTVTVKRSNDQNIYVTINKTKSGVRERIVINGTGIIQMDGYGDTVVNLTVSSSESAVPTGSILVARASSGGTTASALSKPSRGEGNNALGVLRITEVGTTTFKHGTKITLTLPTNIEWNNPTVSALGGIDSVLNASIEKDSSNSRKAHIYLTANPATYDADGKVLTYASDAHTLAGIVEVVTNVKISTKASYGDIEVKVEGNGDVTSESLVIGVFADYIASLSVSDEKQLVSGQIEQEAGKIIIKEGVKGTLTPSRNIELTLPKGVKFSSDETGSVDVKVTKGTNIVDTVTVNNKYDELVIALKQDASSTAATIEVNFKELNIAPDFEGDIVVQIAGRAGISGDVVIGEVVPALTANVGKSEVKLGFKDQVISDFVFTESEAGAVKEGTVYVIAPSGITFGGSPKVTVTDGNLDLKDGKVRIDNRTGYLEFDVDAESTRASEITISGIVLNVDRTVPVGSILFDVNGSEEGSISESYQYQAKSTEPYFDYSLAFSFVGAQCITPASNEIAYDSSFVIGSTTYVLNGVDQSMPVAPYIKDSRTFMPVRYVAYAMGITPENILWNGESRTVTLIKGSQVVQLTIGSNIMTYNGTQIALDTNPEIVDGYTMLPIALVVKVFGYNATWDAATQTVQIIQTLAE